MYFSAICSVRKATVSTLLICVNTLFLPMLLSLILLNFSHLPHHHLQNLLHLHLPHQHLIHQFHILSPYWISHLLLYHQYRLLQHHYFSHHWLPHCPSLSKPHRMTILVLPNKTVLLPSPHNPNLLLLKSPHTHLIHPPPHAQA